MPKTRIEPPAEGGSYVTVKGRRERVAFTGPAEARRGPAPEQATPETPPAAEQPARTRGRRATEPGDVTDG